MISSDKNSIIGHHILAEFMGCNSALLDNEEFLIDRLKHAAKQSNATILDVSSHHFQPHGVTAILLLAESHFSIHTWPEHDYAAVDIFTCGESMAPEKGIQLLKQALGCNRISIKNIKRGDVQ